MMLYFTLHNLYYTLWACDADLNIWGFGFVRIGICNFNCFLLFMCIFFRYKVVNSTTITVYLTNKSYEMFLKILFNEL